MYSHSPDQLKDARYARLRSFRGDGAPVDTPVWFAMDGRQVVFRTKVGPKTKRLAERDDLELAACDYRGRIRPGTAQLAGQAGHTPGSVGVLAHTLRGWVLIAGDAAWHELQIENARQKSGYPGVLVDEDCDETFKTLQRLHLARHSVRIAPTQDHHAALRLSAPA